MPRRDPEAQREYLRAYRARKKAENVATRSVAIPVAMVDLPKDTSPEQVEMVKVYFDHEAAALAQANTRIVELETEVKHLKRELARRPPEIVATADPFDDLLGGLK